MNEILCAKTNKPPLSERPFNLKRGYSKNLVLWIGNGLIQTGLYDFNLDAFFSRGRKLEKSNIVYFQVIPTLEEIEKSKF